MTINWWGLTFVVAAVTMNPLAVAYFGVTLGLVGAVALAVGGVGVMIGKV